MRWEPRSEGGIEVRERPGEGPALMLLHGIGGHADSFAPLLPLLPEGRRVIAWCAPGYGASAPLPQDWPLAADYAEALLHLADALGLDRFALAGHSLGCLIAGAFAARHPGRLTRLLLAAPALGHGGVPGDLSDGTRDRIADLEALGPAAFAAKRAPRLLHAPDRNPADLAAVEAQMARVTMPGYGQAARMLASGRLLEDAARIATPADVIVGAEDAVTPPEAARRLFAALPARCRGVLTEVPEAGHALYTQAPAAFAAALARAMAPAPQQEDAR